MTDIEKILIEYEINNIREDTIIYEDENFTSTIKNNYKKLLNKNMKAFIGYALGQSKKFGIKGARYDELDDFVKKFNKFVENIHKERMEVNWDSFKSWVSGLDYKYIGFVYAPGPRGNGSYEEVEYFLILGKMFPKTATYEYVLERIISLYNQFGNRTISTSKTKDKVDFKALSHAYRISSEVVELIETGMIEFPLKNSEFIKEIKMGNIDSELVIDLVQQKLECVNILLENSDLPKESEIEFITEFILKVVKD